AIALLRALPLDADPRFPRRLAIAYQHRGLALLAQDSSHPAPAIAACTSAIAVLDSDPGAPVADRRYLQAAVYLDLANVRAGEQTFDSDLMARDAADQARSLVSALEASDPDAADAGLKARHILCRTAARHLTRTAVRARVTAEDVHLATDLVDEGLALVHRWERQGVDRFRDLGLDFFQFGTLLYGRYQPHFLAELVLENLDPSRTSEGYAAIVATTPVARHLQSQAGFS
ncbi:MAG: hypothetical protein ABIX28_12175, partial [Vicinamibacterales bacterium]